MAARQTTTYEKRVITPGAYRVVKDGKVRVVDTFSPDRLRRMAVTGNKMLHNGLNIPFPLFHFDDQGQLPMPVTISADGAELDPITGKPINWNSKDNGGFVKAWYNDADGTLVAVVDSYGDKNDHSTPAGKIGTTIKETSLGIASTYTDGKGRIYEDAPIHLAGCLKAIEPGQSDFNLVSEEEAKAVTGPLSLVSMSTQLCSTVGTPKIFTMDSTDFGGNIDRPASPENSDDLPGASMGAGLPQLLSLLRQLKSPIDLPADTSEDTLVERLTVALLQKKADEKSADEDQGGKPQPPRDAKEKNGPARYQTMSTTTDNAAGENAGQGQVTPAAPTKTELMLMSQMATQQAEALQAKAANLVSKGVPQKWVDENIKPLLTLETTTMSAESFDDKGKILSLVGVSTFLSLAESMLAAMPKGNTTMSGQLDYQPTGAGELRPEDDITAADQKKFDDEMVADLIGSNAAR